MGIRSWSPISWNGVYAAPAELALAVRELAAARLKLARRDTVEAFARAPSPSAMMH